MNNHHTDQEKHDIVLSEHKLAKGQRILAAIRWSHHPTDNYCNPAECTDPTCPGRKTYPTPR